MSLRRSRAKRVRLRLSESRSARRMNSASVSGVKTLVPFSSYSSSSATSTPSGARLERDRLGAPQLLVLDLERLPRARLVGRDPFDHAPAAAGLGVPDRARSRRRPLALELDQVAEAVDPDRPALRVIPQRLGLGGQARHGRRRGSAARPTARHRVAPLAHGGAGDPASSDAPRSAARAGPRPSRSRSPRAGAPRADPAPDVPAQTGSSSRSSRRSSTRRAGRVDARPQRSRGSRRRSGRGRLHPVGHLVGRRHLDDLDLLVHASTSGTDARLKCDHGRLGITEAGLGGRRAILEEAREVLARLGRGPLGEDPPVQLRAPPRGSRRSRRRCGRAVVAAPRRGARARRGRSR